MRNSARNRLTWSSLPICNIYLVERSAHPPSYISCKYTPFGCCLDGQTSAKGARGEGCPHRQSKWKLVYLFQMEQDWRSLVFLTYKFSKNRQIVWSIVLQNLPKSTIYTHPFTVRLGRVRDYFLFMEVDWFQISNLWNQFDSVKTAQLLLVQCQQQRHQKKVWNMNKKILAEHGIYLLKVNKDKTKAMCEICSKLTIEKLEWCQWSCFGVFIVNLE